MVAIVLSKEDKIVLFINSYSRDEFREKFLHDIARRDEFSSALDEQSPKIEDLRTLRDLMVAAGVPAELITTDKKIREAAQAVMNRIMESLH